MQRLVVWPEALPPLRHENQTIMRRNVSIVDVVGRVCAPRGECSSTDIVSGEAAFGEWHVSCSFQEMGERVLPIAGGHIKCSDGIAHFVECQTL